MVEANMEAEVTLRFKGGASVVSHRPIFSTDGETVFMASKKSVFEYSRKTGKLIFEYKGSTNVIGFGYLIYDSNSCLVTCFKSGKIVVWRTVTHYKVLETQIPGIHSVQTFNVIVSENTEDLKACISYVIQKKVLFALLDIKKRVLNNFPPKLDGQKYFLDVSEDKYFSVAQGNTVYFVPLDNTKPLSRHTIRGGPTFTCIACHPSEEIVITGDSLGRAVVWQNIFSYNKIQTVFHWHTLPVRTVCFSTSGSFFYTGGEECVLVKWQFDNPKEKSFLPRLADEIEHVSVAVNNLYVAVSTKDNAVRILDNQMEQINVIQHLIFGKQYESGIIYDPRTKALVMNGYHGHLQFYSPRDMSPLYSVDVVGQNRITNERDCIIENTEVRKVALSKSSMWLATVEERKDKIYHSELRLKFWKFNSEIQNFELNTSVEYPHYKSIKDILFQPANNDDNLRCVTLADDKKFKIWQITDSTTVYKKDVVWKCVGVGHFRDLSCAGLSFSMDGSLMAIGFGPIVTTWTPDSCEMKCSLLHPCHKEKIKYVKFGYNNQCHLLVSASASQLSVWNLLTLCMIWTVPVTVKFLIADPLSTHMAVISSDGKLFVFTPNSAVPVFTNEILLKKQKIIAAAFVPSDYNNDISLKWYERSHLYFINSENELYYVSSTSGDLDIKIDVLDSEKSVFSKMLPNTKVNLAPQIGGSWQLFNKDSSHKTFEKFLEAPIHTMAPIRFTCYSLLKSLTVQKEPVS